MCGYVLLFAWSFIRGCNENGLLAAANEARGFVPSLAAMLYFSSAPFEEQSLHRFVKLYLLFGTGLCVVMLLAVLGVPVGATLNLSPDDNRVLPSNAAAALAICAFFALARATYSSQRIVSFVWTGIFLTAAIVLRHRTVWMMLLAGTVALLFVDGRLFRRIVPIAFFASTAVAVLVFVGGATQVVASQGEFAQSLSNSETWQWRVNGWEGFLLDTDQTPLTALAGKPMGSGWWRIDPESHLLQTAPPHSELVTEYLRVGGLGLLLVVLFACRPLWVMWRDGGIDGGAYPSASIWFAVVLMTLVYGVTYSIEPESYALVGIASAMAAGARPAVQDSAADRNEAGESSDLQVRSGGNLYLQKAAILIACHNRRDLTLASLDMLFRQRSISDLEIQTFLVDDGCTDGTGEAVRSRFPSVHVLRGNGSFYWNGAMRLAFAVAMNLGFDAYIFLNDDTILYKDALERMVCLAREQLAAGAPRNRCWKYALSSERRSELWRPPAADTRIYGSIRGPQRHILARPNRV